jgi:hypothetical protein
MNETKPLTESEWREIIRNKRDFSHISKERIKKSIALGIPDKYRAQIWCLLCEFKD